MSLQDFIAIIKKSISNYSISLVLYVSITLQVFKKVHFLQELFCYSLLCSLFYVEPCYSYKSHCLLGTDTVQYSGITRRKSAGLEKKDKPTNPWTDKPWTDRQTITTNPGQNRTGGRLSNVQYIEIL
jgi:hypothetical protein